MADRVANGENRSRFFRSSWIVACVLACATAVTSALRAQSSDEAVAAVVDLAEVLSPNELAQLQDQCVEVFGAHQIVLLVTTIDLDRLADQNRQRLADRLRALKNELKKPRVITIVLNFSDRQAQLSLELSKDLQTKWGQSINRLRLEAVAPLLRRGKPVDALRESARGVEQIARTGDWTPAKPEEKSPDEEKSPAKTSVEEAAVNPTPTEPAPPTASLTSAPAAEAADISSLGSTLLIAVLAGLAVLGVAIMVVVRRPAKQPTEGMAEKLLGNSAKEYEWLLESPTARLALHRLWQSPIARSLVREISLKCTLSPLYANVIQELRSPMSIASQTAEIISRDPELSGNLLRFVNSGYFALPQYISTVELALNRLPREVMEGLMYLAHIEHHFTSPIAQTLLGEGHTHHLLATAGFARRVAISEHAERLVPDSVIAGLLHDVGERILAERRPDEYRQVIQAVREERQSQLESEMRLLGASHADLGAYLAGLWKLPEPVIAAIFFHHRPLESADAELSVLAITHIADTLAVEEFPTHGALGPSFLDDAYLLRIRRVGDRPAVWRQQCRTLCQEIFDAQHMELSPADVKLVESWVSEFDRNWDERRLKSRLEGLPPVGSVIRRTALLELTRADMRHYFTQGRPRTIEHYLREFPELGTLEDPPVELLHGEYELLESAGEDALAVLKGRFPGLALKLDEMVQKIAAGVAVSSSKTVPIGGRRTEARGASATRSPGQPIPLPEQFGRYRILRPLGQGGMGSVYLANDTLLDRLVAIKVPHFGETDPPEVLERFYREARAAARIDHPNLCPVYDVNQIEGIHHLTMAYIEGDALTRFASVDSLMPQPEVRALIHKLALALEEAHRTGIVHRDLKPSNILFNKRHEPIIMDFGLARRTDKREIRLTGTTSPVGTPAYMSPEQVTNDLAADSPTTDIYSLGVIMYELLTGRLPFDEQSASAMFVKIVIGEPPQPRSLRPEVDPQLEAICMKAMAREVRDRFATMQEFAEALAEVRVTV